MRARERCTASVQGGPKWLTCVCLYRIALLCISKRVLLWAGGAHNDENKERGANMKYLSIGALFLSLISPASAQSYTVQRFGNQTYVNGSNGYRANEQRFGNQTYGRNSLGRSWTSQTFGNQTYTNVLPGFDPH